jgi:hypothetical protein
MRHRVVGIVVLLGCALPALTALTGCGPVISTYLIVSAQADLDGAKAAEAEKYAVYEYTAADQYLHKAREEQGYADFGPAIDFAFKADDLAQKATNRAKDEKKKQMEQPSADWQAPTDVAPTGSQPGIVIKKKDESKGDDMKVKVVPIPIEQGPRPK